MRMPAITPALLLLATACASVPPPQAPPAQTLPEVLNLRPNEARDVGSIDVADPMEAALLQQELKLMPIRLEGSRLYFAASGALNEQLRSFGYEPKREEPLLVHNRLVQIERVKDAGEEAILAAGVRIVNREDKYWIAYGSLAALQNLSRGGYRIAAVRGEPRPREVKIQAATLAEVQKIGAMNVDIFTVQPLRKGATQQRPQGYEVYGAAFDEAIDQLRSAGYTVERISTVPERRPQ